MASAGARSSTRSRSPRLGRVHARPRHSHTEWATIRRTDQSGRTDIARRHPRPALGPRGDRTTSSIAVRPRCRRLCDRRGTCREVSEPLSEQATYRLRVTGPAERGLARRPEGTAAAIVEFMLGALIDNPRRVDGRLQRKFPACTLHIGACTESSTRSSTRSRWSWSIESITAPSRIDHAERIFMFVRAGRVPSSETK